MESEKSKLRQKFKEKRFALEGEEFNELNNKLLKVFKQVPLHKIEYFHFFIPIKKFREPNTIAIVDWLKQKHPNTKLVTSRCLMESGRMEHFCDFNLNQLIENKWGIPEPVDGKLIASDKLDAVLVPLLVFDKSGHRVGYGKGFYDRFLVECRSDCLKIGISLFEPIDKIKDYVPTDVKLDLCITPTKLWLKEDFV